MGPDGHTASLFPGSTGAREPRALGGREPVDSPLTKGPTTRLTLTFPAIDAARHVRFLVAGADKAETLAHVAAGPNERYPSSLVTASDTVWLVDRAAVGRIGSKWEAR